MSDWKNRATKVDSTNNWKSRAQAVSEPAENDDANLANTILNKGLEGASMSFNDEFAGGVNAAGKMIGLDNLGSNKLSDVKISDGGPTLSYEKLKAAYEYERNHRRALSKLMDEQHPMASTIASTAGSLAVPMGAAKTLAGKAAIGAGQGAINAYGMDNSDNLADTAKNVAMGAGIGTAIPVAFQGVSKLASKIPTEPIKKGLAKIGSAMSGMDEESLLRQAQRPTQMAAAESDNFAYNLANQAKQEVADVGTNLGQSVGKAKDKFLAEYGKEPMTGASERLSGELDAFLDRNAASGMGFSGLTENQIETLGAFSNNLKRAEMTGNDLVKFREHLDFAEKLAGKYDKEGTGLYTRFLKQLRGKADSMLDNASEEINSANSAYSKFLDNKQNLGLNNESTAESIVNNLYGNNKTAKQLAAEALLPESTMQSLQDIAANKASKIQGPSGSDLGKRTLIGPAVGAMVGSFGAGPIGGAIGSAVGAAVTSPTAWKTGMRAVGKVEKKVGDIGQRVMNSKFGPALQAAKARGNSSYAVSHFLLQANSPEYRELIKADKENPEGE